jgi:hypothetical protein
MWGDLKTYVTEIKQALTDITQYTFESKVKKIVAPANLDAFQYMAGTGSSTGAPGDGVGEFVELLKNLVEYQGDANKQKGYLSTMKQIESNPSYDKLKEFHVFFPKMWAMILYP